MAIAGIATICAAMSAGLGSAQAAEAPAVIVPCQVAALVTAIDNANSGSGQPPTVLSLAPACVYRLTAGLPVVIKPITIQGNGATLQRNFGAGTPVFTILQANGTGAMTISNLNFRHGSGAIAIRGSSTLIVNGGTFTGNTAPDGGAIYDASGVGGPVVTGATFTGNSATDSGGAIYDFNGMNGVQLTGCTFTANTAANSGGAVYDFSVGETVTGSTFRGNRAGFGGAMLLDPQPTASLSGDVLVGNTAATDGGAILSDYGIDIKNSTISDNHAGSQGGGLYHSLGLRVTLEDTEVHGNSAMDGGGIYNASGGSGSTALTNVMISGNHASAHGGGIYNHGPLTATSTTITGNVASMAGGIYDDGSEAVVTLTTSAVVHNKPDNCEPVGSITGCTG